MVRKMAAVLAGLALCLVPRFHAPLQAQPPAVELVSVGTDGIAGNNQSGSDGLIPARTRISADGRYLVFESYASTIVCNDNDFSTRDVFVRDRLTGTATVASVPWDGGEANHDSFDPVISADGRYVAFSSQATNLVPGDTNAFNDIFLRDLQAGTTTRLSVSSTGEQSNSVSHAAAISADGRYVAFYSGGSNLVPGDTNNNFDIFVRDVLAGTTERVSVTTSGDQGSCCSSLYPSITADGRYVAFLSQGRLDPPINNNNQEIYIRDRMAGTTTLVRPAANGDLSNTGIRFADISADGRFVAFMSNSDNIVVPDQNGFVNDVFVKDLLTETTILVSQATDGTQGNHDSWMPSISADGRFVAFHSWANNLVPGDTNTIPVYDVFVRDTVLGTTTRVNLTPIGGEADGSSVTASISADGSLVAFESTATNLVPNERINGFQDVFLAGPSYPGAAGTSFQFDSSSYSETEAGGSATITVTRTGPLCTPATVQYATSDGTATAGADYTPASGTLNFLADEASETFDVALLDDGLDEPDETVLLSLSNPSGEPVLGSPSAATLTIVDDDTPANAPPDALDDLAATAEDAAVGIAVLANDSDADGDPLTITAVTQGTHGAVADNGSGTLTYAPSANFNGSDMFQYTVGDGRGGTATASVVVTVAPVNDAPTAAPDQYVTRQDAVLSINAVAGVLANDADPDGDGLTAVVVAGPAKGTLALAPDGSFTYTPQAGFAGSDSFTYRAWDPQGGSSAATVTLVVEGTAVPVSTCRPVTPATVHRVPTICSDFLGEPFLVNRRLGLIEDGTVPCVEVDTMEATRCLFQTGADRSGTIRLARRASGPWLEDREGRRYAVVGQPVTRDGALASGAYIVGTVPDADGNVACVGASGRDAAAVVAGTDAMTTGILETAGSETNALGLPLVNYVKRYVGTTTLVHPDGVQPVAVDLARGIAWYTGEGAALNDSGGMEQDPDGVYYAEREPHFVITGGVMVPAAKRPSTRSFPAPGVVNVNSRIRWLVANPYVTIANDPPFDPRGVPPPTASFTFSIGLTTLWVDASGSTGDIVRYMWDLSWTSAAPDARGASPTAEFPVTFEGIPPTHGFVTLTVIGRDGQTAIARERVRFRSRTPPILGNPGVPNPD